MYDESRFLVKTPMNPTSGYGRDGISLTQNLLSRGFDVHIEPDNIGIPLPPDVAQLFCKDRPKHFEYALHHAYPGALGFPPTMGQYADKIVGWTMYEFTGFGDEEEMTHQLELRLQSLDLLVLYDDVSKSAFLPHFPEEKMFILQGGYDADFWKPSDDFERDWDSTIKFCMNGTMNLRKNPWATMFAFKLLKEEHGDAFDAELHMKTTSMALPPQLEGWCPGLHIHYSSWTPEQLKQFYMNMHCLVAPSWGEGKNLPALEAQTTGCVAAISAVGGHLQWADNDWAYLMDGPMEEHRPEMGSMRVSVETVAETMWHIYNNRTEAKMKGEKASQIIPAQCDWSVVLDKLQFRMQQISR